MHANILLGVAFEFDENEHLNRPPESHPTINMSLSSLFTDAEVTFKKIYFKA